MPVFVPVCGDIDVSGPARPRVVLGYRSLGFPENVVKASPVAAMLSDGNVLALGSPGTGKTAACAVPSIVAADDQSVIVFDSRRSLLEMTGAYRAGISDLYAMDLSKPDFYPVVPNAREEAVVFSRFNVLSKGIVPPKGELRNRYFETLAGVLVYRHVPDRSDYFPDQAFQFIVGSMHALVSVVNDGADPDRWKSLGLGDRWRDREASLSMLADWIAVLCSSNRLREVFSWDRGDDSDDLVIADRAVSNHIGWDRTDDSDDLVGRVLERICDLINPAAHEGRISTTSEGFASLSRVVLMADRERSGVMGTASQALLSYRNQMVEDKTFSSDFDAADIRGVHDAETGKIRPFSLYISTKGAEAATFAQVSSVMLASLGFLADAYGPGVYVPASGRAMGPLSVVFVLDDVALAGRMNSLVGFMREGIRSRVSYLLTCESFQALQNVYGEQETARILDACRVRMFFGSHDRDQLKLMGFYDFYPSLVSCEDSVGLRDAASESVWLFGQAFRVPERLSKASWFFGDHAGRVHWPESRMNVRDLVPSSVREMRIALHYLYQDPGSVFGVEGAGQAVG